VLEQLDLNLTDTVSADLPSTLLGNTALIVSGYVTRNQIDVAALPRLIQTVHGTLSSLAKHEEPIEFPKPAVDPKKSVFPDYLVCLEDGKQMVTLKRHLMASYGMTPEQYRLRWSLPATYPMVAPNYAKHRSELAKDMGLGVKTPEKVPVATKGIRRKSA
jgi:predicted transcriptional regulator